jgi:multidrug resistance efflux pump
MANGKLRLTLHVLHFALIALLLVGCASAQAETDGALTASGFIEGEEVTVAAETDGRIAEILVDRGDSVAKGDVVVRLDDEALQSQRAEAEAGLAAAKANRDRALAGARAEEITAARAALAEAEARRDGAEKAVTNAEEAVDNPQSIDMQVEEARTQVALAEQNVELAEAELAETELKYNLYKEKGGDTEKTWELQLQAARADLREAQAQLEGAQTYLNVMQAKRANPLSLKAQLHKAEMEYQIAEAEVEAAQARLDELEAGPTEEAVALAEAQVQQAETAVDLIDAKIDQLTLTAPMSGTVSSRSAQVGETATAGKPLLTITNLDEVTLVIYIPENRIGEVKVGQKVEVTVDSFPERTFTGQVASIAGEAEFTPRNVQTKEERVNLVFAVDVSIPNPDHALKAGMPADATIAP